MKGNGHEMKQERFSLDVRRNFSLIRIVKQWQRLPREDEHCPFLKIFRLGKAMSILSTLRNDLLWAGGQQETFYGPFQSVLSCDPFVAID